MTNVHEAGQERVGIDPTLRVMELIHGEDIEKNLLNLAQIGGTPIEGITDQPVRYAVNRLALSPIDVEARRTFVRPLMEAAGMTVQEHPLGLIGTLKGEEPDLPPVVIISHTDSVPRADMYDGVTGVIGGIKVVEALTAAGITTKRNIHVVALTGEESSAFGFALFGSRGMWQGLDERELDAHIPGGKTIRETLGEAATEIVKHPVVGKDGLIPTPHAVIELHVEQNDTLDKAGIDLGVVEAIAAPVRFNVEVGEKSLEPDTVEPEHAAYFRLMVQGKSDHSGATPMGTENRADGLVETAEILWDVTRQTSDTSIVDIGNIEISEQALNKIPGSVTTNLRVSGNSPADLAERIAKLQEVLDQANADLANSRFEGPTYLEEIDKESAGTFYKREEILGRQQAALSLIVDVNRIATSYTAQKVVGTVGTYALSPDGKISLGLDVRGIDKESRDEAITHMRTMALLTDVANENIARFGEPLPGSGDPVTLDAELVKTTKELIDKLKVGSSVVMFSAAGHDAQNAAKAGHPTVMIFCQSNRGGIAHHPDAYTRPENLEQGVRALAALTARLAN